jgi:hypothetical protein
VRRTHLSHFQIVAITNVYEHIGHPSWDKCAPRQMCSYTASNIIGYCVLFRFEDNLNLIKKGSFDNKERFQDSEMKLVAYH